MRFDERMEQPVKWLLRLMIRIYQMTISRMLPPVCRFEPSCSRYAMQALERKRLLVALGLIIWRLARCNPLCRGGFDPLE